MRILAIFFVLITSCVNAQVNTIKKIEKRISKINSEEQAAKFILQNIELNGSIEKMDSKTDSSAFDFFWLHSKEVFNVSDSQYVYVVKIINKYEATSFRVSYIYLDSKILSLNQIDSLRSLIVTEINSGVSFESLASNYSMDANSKKGGDLGWFSEGDMVKGFEEQIKKHNLGDVYNVDVKDKQWHYVVKNTYSPSIIKHISLLIITIKK